MLGEINEGNKLGTLYIVGTPIGNLEDITLRALRVLKEVDLIAAEDTRVTKKLLRHYEINTPITSCHEYSRRAKLGYIISQIKAGKDVALVSDAGMPGISDPGYELIRWAIGEDIPIVPIPGPTALVTALAVSGLSGMRFCFDGFLPRRRKERREKLGALVNEPRTLVLYEAPHRLINTLKDILAVLGDRQAVVVRELTKRFEEIVHGKVSELVERFNMKAPRGEFTIVLAGAEEGQDILGIEEWSSLSEQVKGLMAKGLSKKEAIKEVAELRGLPKREVYEAVIEEDTEGSEEMSGDV